MSLLQHLNIGFIGAGNMTSTIVSRLIGEKVIKSENIWISNRTQGKLLKLKENWKINIANTNEEVIEKCQVVILAIKPQDFYSAIETVSAHFTSEQLVVSLLAGITLDALEKLIPQARLVRVMPNTPSSLGKGVIGYSLNDHADNGAKILIEELLSPLGYVVPLEEGDMFDALLVSSSSGTGFILELMSYWQDWIEERGFSSEIARQMTVETFLGTSMLASKEANVTFEDLLQRVASKKGVTAAGLDSMRELEIERALRLSFEKSWMKNQELSRSN